MHFGGFAEVTAFILHIWYTLLAFLSTYMQAYACMYAHNLQDTTDDK